MQEVEKKTGPPVDPQAIEIGAPDNRAPEKTAGSGPPDSNSQGKCVGAGLHDPPDFPLDGAEALDPEKFPNQRTGNNGKGPPTTIPTTNQSFSVSYCTARNCNRTFKNWMRIGKGSTQTFGNLTDTQKNPIYRNFN